MTTTDDALHAAEAALDAAKAAVAAEHAPVEHDGVVLIGPPIAGGEPGPDAPPADDAHVAVGSSLFSDPAKLKEAPAESVYLGHIGEPAVEGKDF